MGNTSSVSFVDRSLATAAEKGNLSYVRSLVEKDGGNVNFVDQYGWSPLLHAVAEGHANVVSYLISKGANVFQKNADGSSALHLAVAADSEEVVNILISQGLEVNAQNENGWTPLHLAGLAGNTAVVFALLQNGADPNKINREGNTPLKVTTSLAVSKVFREFEESKASAETKATNPVSNNASNDTEVTVYEQGVESTSSQSTREQISQLRTLQNRTRAQPTEMKGYSALDDADEPLIDSRSNNNNIRTSSGTTDERHILAAIHTLRDLKPESLNIAQLDELMEFHNQQLTKYTAAKKALEEKRQKEMDQLLAG